MANKRLQSDAPLPIETNFELPAPIPEWPGGTNFASGVIDLGALQVAQITSLNKVWSTDGGPNNLGSTYYEPTSIPDGFHMLGCYSQANNQPLYGWVLVAKDVSLPVEPPGLVSPIDYTPVYNFEPANGGVGYIWLPVAPDGYSAMGYVVTASPQKPSLDKVRVVRSVLTEDVEVDNWIWGNDYDGINVFSSRPVDRGSTSLGISMGTFLVQISGKPDDKLACLSNFNFSYPSMPNKNQVEALIEAYAPVVYFHPEERFFPSRVSWFFQNGAQLFTKEEKPPVRIAYNGWNLPQNGSNDGAYWIDLPSDRATNEKLRGGNLQEAYSYMHIKSVLGGTFTDIQVWLFYPFNGPGKFTLAWVTISLERVGEHVGDWEHVTLRISNFNGELKSVYFAQHSKGEWVSSSGLEFETDNKPVVYSSRYAHASYPTPGTFIHTLAQQNAFAGGRNDTSKSANKMDTGARYWILSADYLGGLGIVEPPWLNYAREWGPKKEFKLEVTLEQLKKKVPFILWRKLEEVLNGITRDILGEEGPVGPKWQSVWSGDEKH